MSTLHRIGASLLVGVAIPISLSAQSLQLEVRGGSMPGPLSFELAPALYPFELMLVVPSTSPGPTPIQLFDPNDPRSLSIGLDLVANAWATLADINGNASFQVQLGAAPALVDVPLYFQAVTFYFSPTLLDRLSNPQVVRLGLADTFRDRNASMFWERAFGTALQREDGRPMIVGGARGQLLAQSATDTTDVYDPMSDTFSFGPTMSAPRSLHTMTELSDGRFLIVGGVNASNDPQATCEIYDPTTDAFTPVAAMGSPRMGHTATLLGDGRVFVSGGLDAVSVQPTQLSAIRDAVDTTEIYDPVANTWTPGPVMNKPRAAHFALQRSDGVIVLGGGISWDPVIIIGWLPAVRASCDLYDPVANSIAAGPSMASPRALTDAVALGGDRWLLAGGMSSLTLTNAGTPTATAEIYDGASNSWTTVGPLATARANHRGWAIGGGRFLLAGGASGSILQPTSLSSTEVFDVATGVFTPGPSLNTARAGAGAFLTAQGQMLVFGGADATGTVTTSTEWYYF